MGVMRVESFVIKSFQWGGIVAHERKAGLCEPQNGLKTDAYGGLGAVDHVALLAPRSKPLSTLD
jgi:hypothetical protein